MTRRVIDSRPSHGGLARTRRYNNGTITVELPIEALNTLAGVGRVNAALRAWRDRQNRWERNEQARMMLKEGWKPLAVAHALGMSESNVRSIRSAVRQSKPSRPRRRS